MHSVHQLVHQRQVVRPSVEKLRGRFLWGAEWALLRNNLEQVWPTKFCY